MDQQTFDALASLWQSDIRIGMSSNPRDVCRHPGFQLLIDEGPSVVPMVFKALEKDYEHAWPMALRIFLGHSPVMPVHRGRSPMIQRDWVEWGKANGYL